MTSRVPMPWCCRYAKQMPSLPPQAPARGVQLKAPPPGGSQPVVSLLFLLSRASVYALDDATLSAGAAPYGTFPVCFGVSQEVDVPYPCCCASGASGDSQPTTFSHGRGD